jgi:hypothetical protein
MATIISAWSEKTNAAGSRFSASFSPSFFRDQL